jgi:hypothetical protein
MVINYQLKDMQFSVMGLSISFYLLEISNELGFNFAINQRLLLNGYLGLRGKRCLETGGI